MSAAKPVRIQLRRFRGFQLQKTSQAINGLPAVKVDRSSKFGNPYRVERAGDRSCITYGSKVLGRFRDHHEALVVAISGFENDTVPTLDLCELKGKNLACWCSPDAPCHADVLLRLAND